MNTAIYFTDLSDYQENRLFWLRIPQVIQRLRSAHAIIEAHGLSSFDLITYLGSEDSFYLHHRELREFVSGLVQLGLYDRFLTCSFFPQYLVGKRTENSALRVAAGELSFAEFVCSSSAVTGPNLRLVEPEPVTQFPVVRDMQLSNCDIYSAQLMRSGDLRFCLFPFASQQLRDVVQMLVEQQGVSRWVNVGTDNRRFYRSWPSGLKEDVRIINSLNVDPVLSWLQTRSIPMKAMAH